MSYDLLVEIALDTGTERLSLYGSKTAAGVYEACIDSVSDLVREIKPAGGVSPTESGRLAIRDCSGAWRQKLALTPWKKRTITLKLANLETGAIETIAVAKIENTPIDRESIEIDFRDDSQDRLEEPVSPLLVFPDLFPAMPETTPVALIPIPLGTISSADFGGRGHLPAYLVDPKIGQAKYRYAAAQIACKSITAVYRDGLLVATGYAIAYANVATSEYGAVRMTFIDFDSDQRESGRDVEITYDCQGLTDTGLEGGITITNPAAALKAFLVLRGVLTAGEFDATLQAAAEAAYTAAGITAGLAVVDEDDTWLDVADRFAEAYNLQLFRTRTGKFAMRFDNAAGASPTGLPHFLDSQDIHADSCSFEPPEESASTLEFRYAADFARNDLTGRNSCNDATEETALGRDVRDNVELAGIRNVNQGKKICQIKLFQGRSSRYLGSLRLLEPQPTFELGDHIRITHFEGPASDGLGFRDKVFQVLGLTLTHSSDSGLAHELQLIDAPGLVLGAPADTEPGRTTQVIPPESVGLSSDIVWTPTDQDTVAWSGCTLKLVWGRNSVSYAGIAGGSTGNMAGVLYVYFDPDVNTAALQTTTDYASAIGGRKRLLAECRKAPSVDQLALVKNHVGFVAVNGANVPSYTSGDNLPDDSIAYRHLQVDSVHADTIEATAIDGMVITGATLQTSAPNPKVIEDSINGFRAIDSGGNVRVQIPTSGDSIILRAHDTEPGTIIFGSNGQMFATTTETDIVQLAGLNGAIVAIQATGTTGAVRINGGTSSYAAELQVGGTATFGLATILFDAVPTFTFLKDSGGIKAGFFGAAAVAKPTVAGARNANPALTDLLTDLALLGLVTDSTTPGNSPFDAANISSGTLSTDRFSAYSDLGAEAKIGTGATQVAAGDHTHSFIPLAGSVNITGDLVSNNTSDLGSAASPWGTLFANQVLFSYDADTYGSLALNTDATYGSAALEGRFEAGKRAVVNAQADSTNQYVELSVNGTWLMMCGKFGGTFKCGWFGSVAAQQTVTGSRGGNAALASLLTILASHGIVIDGSS